MENRREYIIDKAFQVFMSVGYDSASMTVLQKELEMSRGAMYRYFESKDDLFKEVIDKYYLIPLNKLIPDLSEDITLLEMIDFRVNQQKRIYKYLDNINSIDVKFLNYTALAIQAAKRYPGFIEKMRKIQTKNTNSWRKAVENSIRKGEIRENIDVDIITSLFGSTLDKTENAGNIQKSFSQSLKKSYKAMLYLYELIKK